MSNQFNPTGYFGGNNVGGFNSQYPNINYAPGYVTNPAISYGTPMMMNQQQLPTVKNSLSDDEIAMMRNSAAAPGHIDLSITQTEASQCICNHFSKDGHMMVDPLNDGTNRVRCRICGSIWDPTAPTREEFEDALMKLHNAWNNIKLTGVLPIEVNRELGGILAVIQKTGLAIFDTTMNAQARMSNINQFDNASDVYMNRMFDTMFGGNGSLSGFVNGSTYYDPAVAAMGGYASPQFNPMQAPTYGFNAQAPNQQFNAQAMNMMNNGAQYAQPSYAPQNPSGFQTQNIVPQAPGYFQQPQQNNGQMPQFTGTTGYQAQIQNAPGNNPFGTPQPQIQGQPTQQQSPIFKQAPMTAPENNAAPAPVKNPMAEAKPAVEELPPSKIKL